MYGDEMKTYEEVAKELLEKRNIEFNKIKDDVRLKACLGTLETSNKTRRLRTCYNIEEILDVLGTEDKIGANQTWVGENYSLAQLIVDLKYINKGDF